MQIVVVFCLFDVQVWKSEWKSRLSRLLRAKRTFTLPTSIFERLKRTRISSPLSRRSIWSAIFSLNPHTKLDIVFVDTRNWRFAEWVCHCCVCSMHMRCSNEFCEPECDNGFNEWFDLNRITKEWRRKQTTSRCKSITNEKTISSIHPLPHPFLLSELNPPQFLSLISLKQTIHWVRAFTYGAISSSLNSRNGKSTPTTATEQFSFVNFCITLPFFSPYRIALHAALQRIQHDVNQLIDRHCSSLASLHSYSHRSPSPRSFPRSKTVERGPFSRSGCESRSRTHCILSTRRREMYGRDGDLWTMEKSAKEGKRNVHTADQQTNTVRTTFVCESAEMLF